MWRNLIPRRGFRPRSDRKTNLIVGTVLGVVSGYFIFSEEAAQEQNPVLPDSAEKDDISPKGATGQQK